MHNLYCIYYNRHLVLTMCILFSSLTTKAWVMCKEASKQSTDLKNYTRLGPRPPVLKFLDPPLQTTNVLLENSMQLFMIFTTHSCNFYFSIQKSIQKLTSLTSLSDAHWSILLCFKFSPIKLCSSLFGQPFFHRYNESKDTNYH